MCWKLAAFNSAHIMMLERRPIQQCGEEVQFIVPITRSGRSLLLMSFFLRGALTNSHWSVCVDSISWFAFIDSISFLSGLFC